MDQFINVSKQRDNEKKWLYTIFTDTHEKYYSNKSLPVTVPESWTKIFTASVSRDMASTLIVPNSAALPIRDMINCSRKYTGPCLLIGSPNISCEYDFEPWENRTLYTERVSSINDIYVESNISAALNRLRMLGYTSRLAYIGIISDKSAKRDNRWSDWLYTSVDVQEYSNGYVTWATGIDVWKVFRMLKYAETDQPAPTYPVEMGEKGMIAFNWIRKNNAHRLSSNEYYSRYENYILYLNRVEKTVFDKLANFLYERRVIDGQDIWFIDGWE